MRSTFIKLIACLSIVMALLVPTTAFAAYDPFGSACKAGGGASAACQTDGGNDPINGTIMAVISIMAAVAGIVSIISLIWGGIKYITSAGDAKSVASAKQAVVAAIIGLVIAISARPIVLFVLGKI